MSRPTKHLVGTRFLFRTETETGTDNIPLRTHEETEGLYEMIFAITNELKSMNRRHDEDREEFRTFRKEYEINREERKGSNDKSFREDIRSLIQQITKLEYDLNDIQKSMKIIKHDFSQTLPESYQRDSIFQRETINRPDITLLENDTDARTVTNYRSAIFYLLILYSTAIMCPSYSLLMSAAKFKAQFLLKKRQM